MSLLCSNFIYFLLIFVGKHNAFCHAFVWMSFCQILKKASLWNITNWWVQKVACEEKRSHLWLSNLLPEKSKAVHNSFIQLHDYHFTNCPCALLREVLKYMYNHWRTLTCTIVNSTDSCILQRMITSLLHQTLKCIPLSAVKSNS